MNRQPWTFRIPTSRIPASDESHRAHEALAHSDPVGTWRNLVKAEDGDIKEKRKSVRK